MTWGEGIAKAVQLPFDIAAAVTDEAAHVAEEALSGVRHKSQPADPSQLYHATSTHLRHQQHGAVTAAGGKAADNQAAHDEPSQPAASERSDKADAGHLADSHISTEKEKSSWTSSAGVQGSQRRQQLNGTTEAPASFQ